MLKRIDGKIIPYEYNYYFAINFYEKLFLYNNLIRKIHDPESYSLHTFSNIISKKVNSGLNGLDIPEGFIIFRSLDSRLINYLRLGLSLNPVIKIINTKYIATKIYNWKELDDKNEFYFRTLSPVVVKDFNSGKLYVEDPIEVENNLLKVTLWQLENLFNIKNSELDIKINNVKRKSVRISSKPNGISKTVGFELEGKIKGDPNALKVIYYRGLGSKTGLGLGMIEVKNNEN
jgi:CRISPR-associated endoribonuclease Cas6